MVIGSIWNTNQTHFPPTYVLPLTCQNMSLVFPNNASLERNRLSLCESPRSPGEVLLLMDICTRGCLDCDGSMSLASPDAFALEYLAKVRAQQVRVWACFPLVFFWAGSIAICCIGSLWRRDLINTGSRGQRSRQRTDSTANVLHRPCNVVIKGWCQHCG